MLDLKSSKLHMLLHNLIVPVDANSANIAQQSSSPSQKESTAATTLTFLDGIEPLQIEPTADGYVGIDATATIGQTPQLADALEALGAKQISSYGRVVSALVPVSALTGLESLTSLQFALPVLNSTNVGLVTSQDVEALRADTAQSLFGVDGSKLTLGILSDSFDALGGAAADIASNDLPPAKDIQILEDFIDPSAIDEGRAMAQLVHDIAPGAGIQFATAFTGQAGFANNILALQEAGSDIIVDDIIYFAEPMFADGIIAQAATEVVSKGTPYFSSAGNNADNGYQAEFVDSGVLGAFGGTTHNWNSGLDEADSVLNFTLQTGRTIFVLNWDQPYASTGDNSPGSASDLDLWLTFPGNDPNAIFFGSTSNNIGGDPVEVLGIINSGPPVEVGLAIELFAGPKPNNLSLVAFSPDNSTFGSAEYPSSGATTYGHTQAEGALGIGAARWNQTPSFGVNPPQLEPFSSQGGIPILFDIDGNRLAEPQDRSAVDGVATDGGNTTFFFRDSVIDDDPFPNFFGTSAAAPNAAAVAALMLEANPGLTPRDIKILLQNSAIDMDNPYTAGFDVGIDSATGAGLIQADIAVGKAFVTKTTIVFTQLSDRSREAFADNIVKPEEELTPSNKHQDQRLVAIIGNDNNSIVDEGDRGFVLSKLKNNRAKTLSEDNTDDPVTLTATGLERRRKVADLTRKVRFSERFGFGLGNRFLNHGDALDFKLEYGGTIASAEFTVNTRHSREFKISLDVDGNVIQAIPENDNRNNKNDFKIINDAIAQIDGLYNKDHISIDFLSGEVYVNGVARTGNHFDSLFQAFAASESDKITIGATFSNHDDGDDYYNIGFGISDVVIETGPAKLDLLSEPILTASTQETFLVDGENFYG